MGEEIGPLAVTHLLQHTLRSLCLQENSQWVYAVFWRILPRNFPPPKWDTQGGAYDRTRGNRRNWILVWEDGFCNFAASTASEANPGDYPSPSVLYGNHEFQNLHGLQPELFFKMSHEIYNYGEGLVGKVAADHSHKWIHREPNEQEINFLSAWQNSADSQPRTWEAQFQAGIKTIALIAVREGVVQLGAQHKVIEDLNQVVVLRKKFSYIESIPGVLLPHPSAAAFPYRFDTYGSPDLWHFHGTVAPPTEYGYDHFTQPMKITPSMSSLEALLSKLPSVLPMPQPQQTMTHSCNGSQQQLSAAQNRHLEHMCSVQKEKEKDHIHERDVGECSSSMSSPHQQQQQQQQQQSQLYYHQDLNISAASMPYSGY